MTTQGQQPKRPILGFGRKPSEEGKARNDGGPGAERDPPGAQQPTAVQPALAPAAEVPGVGGPGPAPEQAMPSKAAEAVPAAPARLWPKGPDPSVEPCPKGDATAATLWRKRKAIVDLRKRAADIQQSIVEAGKEERTAYDEWTRRRQLDADRAAARVSRQAGVNADQIGAIADLAKAKGITVDELLKQLQAAGGSPA